MRVLPLLACFVLGSLVALRGASAQPAGAQAESLFREGKRLMADGKLVEACAAFDASQKVDPSVSTMLNQGACREKNYQFATAWDHFLEAERATRNAVDEPTRKLHDVARDRAAKLEKHVSHLTVSVSQEARTDHLEVRIGERAIDEATWNRALPIDGGTYTVTARAPGSVEWTTTVTIQFEADTKTVDVPKLQTAVHAVDPRPAPPPPPVVEPRSHTVPIVFSVAALAAIGGAVGFELWGESTYDRAKATVDPAKQDSLWRSANRERYAAEALGGVGLACAAVAVILFVRDGDEAPRGATALAPIVGGGHTGFAVTGVF